MTARGGHRRALCPKLNGCTMLLSSVSQVALVPSLDAGSKAREEGRRRLTPMRSGALHDARGEVMASVSK
jgi:hypothetical protein